MIICKLIKRFISWEQGFVIRRETDIQNDFEGYSRVKHCSRRHLYSLRIWWKCQNLICTDLSLQYLYKNKTHMSKNKEFQEVNHDLTI